jgi:hypothetical protein
MFMKKILLLALLVSAICLVGCEKNEPAPTSTQVKEVENTDNSVQKLSFEERTKVYFDQLKENDGDKTKQYYTNVRLRKLDDNNYELVADLRGMIKFSKDDIAGWVKTMNDEGLTKYEVHMQNDDTVFIVYSTKPEFVKTNDGCYDEDWKKANDGEWLDENDIPMFIDQRTEDTINLENDDTHFYDSPVFLRQEDDGYYYPRYRSNAGVTEDLFAATAVNEKDAIKIALYPDDKISVDYYEFYGRDGSRQPVEMTVKEYQDNSPTMVNDDLRVDVNNMSDAGFEVEDGVIHVYGCYVGI